MFVTEFGIVMDVKEVHPKKALGSMLVFPLGRTVSTRYKSPLLITLQFDNAPFRMLLITSSGASLKVKMSLLLSSAQEGNNKMNKPRIQTIAFFIV